MATRAHGTTWSAGAAILEQLADLDPDPMSPDTARKLLRLSIESADRERGTELSRKAQDGALLPGEQAELDEFIRPADALAVLPSRSRRALKPGGVIQNASRQPT